MSGLLRRAATEAFGLYLDAFDWVINRVAPIDPAVKRAAADFDARRLAEAVADGHPGDIEAAMHRHPAGSRRAACGPYTDLTSLETRRALDQMAAEADYTNPDLNAFPAPTSPRHGENSTSPHPTPLGGVERPAPDIPPEGAGRPTSPGPRDGGTMAGDRPGPGLGNGPGQPPPMSTAELLTAAALNLAGSGSTELRHALLTRATELRLRQVETGLDMGCRHAAEMFPQHQKPKT